MRFRINILLTLLISFSTGYAQQVDSDSLINNMKSGITVFFIDQGYLDKNEIQKNLDFVYAIEIRDKKMLGYNSKGIYRIGVHQSHSQQHVLIKENSHFQIFDIKRIDETLKEVINFSAKNNVNPDTLLLYIREIIRMYDSNNNNPISELIKKNSGAQVVQLSSQLTRKETMSGIVLSSKRYNIRTDLEKDSIYIKGKLVYVAPVDSVVTYDIVDKKYILVSMYDSTMRTVSAGSKYWNKGVCYIFTLKNPLKKYKTDFLKKYDGIEILSIDDKERKVNIRQRKTGNLIMIDMMEIYEF